VANTAFLRVSAPFHSSKCAAAVAPIAADAARVGFDFGALALPVYSTAAKGEVASLDALISMQATQVTHRPRHRKPRGPAVLLACGSSAAVAAAAEGGP
jgi:hypothetical protein